MLDYCHIQGPTAIAESNLILASSAFQVRAEFGTMAVPDCENHDCRDTSDASGPPASKTCTQISWPAIG
jgi:hypothetical protein